MSCYVQLFHFVWGGQIWCQATNLVFCSSVWTEIVLTKLQGCFPQTGDKLIEVLILQSKSLNWTSEGVHIRSCATWPKCGCGFTYTTHNSMCWLSSLYCFPAPAINICTHCALMLAQQAEQLCTSEQEWGTNPSRKKKLPFFFLLIRSTNLLTLRLSEQ